MISWLEHPGFTTSSTPDRPGWVKITFFYDDDSSKAATIILDEGRAKILAESILDSRSKFLPGGAKVQ